MRQKLFTLAAGVSAVLCAVVCVLWVRSCWRCDLLGHKSASGVAMGLQSYRGSIGVIWIQEPARGPRERHFGYNSTPVRGWDEFITDTGGHGTAGFRHVQIPGRFGYTFVPLWLLLTVFAVLPALAARQWMREWKRRSVGRCPVCGYDLRATPGRCPECGAVPAAAAKGERA
jgi:4-amino-4-deoxy-L-arabinose transferase-like glycosyltransferase